MPDEWYSTTKRKPHSPQGDGKDSEALTLKEKS